MNIRFISINDGYDSAKIQDAIDDQFKMLIYDYYAIELSVKIKNSMTMIKEKGKFVGGYAPHGYVKDITDKNKLAIDREAAAVVVNIFDRACCGIT